MMYKLSNHARTERLERFNKIIETIGLEEVIASVKFEEDDTIHNITSNGIAIITAAKDPTFLITMYMASISYTVELYRRMGRSRVDPYIMRVVEKNLREHKELISI